MMKMMAVLLAFASPKHNGARDERGAMSSDWVLITGGAVLAAIAVMGIYGDRILNAMNSISF